MSKNVTDLLTSIPLRDESIQLALADIEQKLAAWSTAVGNYAPAARDAGKGQIPVSASCVPPPQENSSREPDELAATRFEIAESIVEPTRDNAPEVGPAQSGAIESGQSGDEAADDDLQETPVARPASPDDDESVLVGLSSESAKAIKVQWRLLEGSKSLRQLVEEHKARLVRGDGPRDGKRSWWARGKG